LSGAVFSATLLLLRGGENVKDLGTVPWWMFAVGLPGVVLYLTIAYTIPRIGVTTALTLIIIGQLLTGMIIDHFGLLEVAARSIDGNRLLGTALLLLGAYLIAR
jgi:transporter family-2 protein